MALVQVYNYMLQHGIGYGFVAAREAVVFLYIRGDDLRIFVTGLGPDYVPGS